MEEIAGKTTQILLYCLQSSSKFQKSSPNAYCVHGMGVFWAMVLIGNAKQATSKLKSGLVETWLTRLAAMALLLNARFQQDKKCGMLKGFIGKK